MTLRLAIPRNAEYDNNGNPGAGWKLRFSIVGTSTPKNTFSDPGLVTPNANPVVADASGRFGDIYLTTGQYKVELLDSSDVVIWTADNVDGNPAAGTIGATTVTGTLTLQAALNEAARVSIASASTTNIGAAASSSVLITGTTTINAFDNVAAGIIRKVTFAAVLTLAHNAVSLILPGGANITTAANDTAEFLSLGSGNWLCYHYKRQSGLPVVSPNLGRVVQIVDAPFAAVATGTTQLPNDDTEPQITEGDEYMTAVITPTKTTNILVISVQIMLAKSAANVISYALFRDAVAAALAVGGSPVSVTNAQSSNALQHYMVSGTVAAITFRVRAGQDAAGTTTFNGAAAARKFGTTPKSRITIFEFEPAQ